MTIAQQEAQDLSDRICAYTGKPPSSNQKTTLHIGFGRSRGSHSSLSIESALISMSEMDRCRFLKDLVLVWWLAPTDKTAMSQLAKIFGTDDRIGLGLLYTISANGKQFCAWIGAPGIIASHGVQEQRKIRPLFEVIGEPQEIREYAREVIPANFQAKGVRLPNGTCIFGLWWESDSPSSQ
ncbi:MAG: hypothetical protein A2756_04310 [Candidatus Ryanbacteria bacterium RIFCSPHIGHO2_01_FULL_48_27]|uniref:Uncharacterized protein n=1 Tax=Candidatus Ryanbacteria bacterium RIFCSPHIGHO2_01_FULL_48_27 TaxID=1802115 RepID=A0A1G2G2V0_9BACT|nr:MAG: hypothetical protein A2756_04310 [Candidatus Ryanbacteria bacterium RIFCSPHIGHO2_01_FULL_48_27]